jgi:hypothetical protein
MGFRDELIMSITIMNIYFIEIPFYPRKPNAGVEVIIDIIARNELMDICHFPVGVDSKKQKID